MEVHRASTEESFLNTLLFRLILGICDNFTRNFPSHLMNGCTLLHLWVFPWSSFPTYCLSCKWVFKTLLIQCSSRACHCVSAYTTLITRKKHFSCALNHFKSAMEPLSLEYILLPTSSQDVMHSLATNPMPYMDCEWWCYLFFWCVHSFIYEAHLHNFSNLQVQILYYRLLRKHIDCNCFSIIVQMFKLYMCESTPEDAFVPWLVWLYWL